MPFIQSCQQVPNVGNLPSPTSAGADTAGFKFRRNGAKCKVTFGANVGEDGCKGFGEGIGVGGDGYVK
jgi:hypothetical protein